MRQLSKIVLIFTLVAILPSRTFADCDFSTGIVKNPAGGYTYTVDCHKQVGKMVQDAKDYQDQIQSLDKVISMKDLTIDTQGKEVTLYEGTVQKMDDRLNTIEKMNDTNKVLYFVGGIVFTSLAVWGAGQLIRH